MILAILRTWSILQSVALLVLGSALYRGRLRWDSIAGMRIQARRASEWAPINRHQYGTPNLFSPLACASSLYLKSVIQ